MRTVLALAALLLLLPGPAGAMQERKTVVGVRFEGNRRYTEQFLREQVRTKAGEPLDAALLSLDERTLRSYFTAVTDIEEREVEGGVEVVFHVLDKLTVGQVEVRGMLGVDKEDYKPLLTTRAGRPFHEHTLRVDKETLERLLKEKGYYFAEVRHTHRPSRRANIEDVRFTAFPQRKVLVDKVILEGAHSLDHADLLSGMQNSDRWRHLLLGWINPTTFDREAVDQDRRRMEIRYHLEGFLDARVAFVGVSFDEARRRASLRYRVHEGTRYKVSELNIEYGKQPADLPAEEDRRFLGIHVLSELAGVRAGDPFRREDLDRGKRLVKERLWSRSYALMQMEEVIFPDPENHTVKIILRLRAGQKVRMGRQRFRGNIYTRDKVLRRAFRYGARPGEPLDPKELEVGMNRLRSLRFFSLVRLPNVTGLNPFGLLPANDPQNPDVYDVEVEVQEDDTREFNVGGALSTDGGLIGTFDLRYRNFDITKPPTRLLGMFDPDAFRGAGQEFVISFRPGTTFSSFELTFREPSVRDSLWSFGSSIFQRLALYDTWDQNTTGIVANVGRFLDRRQRWSMAFDWSLREVVVSDLEPNAPQAAFDAQGHSAVHSIGWRLTHDVRRSFGRTITGHRSTLGLTLSGGILGGEVDTFQVDLSHRRGIKLWRTQSGDWWRLTVRGHVGWITSFSDTTDVPIFERYFTGGRDLRGFEFRGIGPRSNGSPEGGDWLATIQMELIMPVSHNPRGGPGIDFVLFLDQGTLTTDFDAFVDDPMWRLTVGFGIGVSLTPGQPPFRFDFGFALLAEDQDDKEVFSFSIQRQF